MNKNYYFLIDDKEVAVGHASWTEFPAPDDKNPHQFDPVKREMNGGWYILAGYADPAGIWQGIEHPEQVLTFDGTEYSEEEFIEKFSATILLPPALDEDGEIAEDQSFVEFMNSIATPELIIKPDIINVKTNPDGSLAESVTKVNKWDGPEGWALREGVEEITLDEFLKAQRV